MNVFDIFLNKNLAALRAVLVIAPIHVDIEPVERYSRLISEETGVPHGAVSLPKNATSFKCGYRFVCIPEEARADYLSWSLPINKGRKKTA